jgi:hypothetical protein
MCPTFNKHLLTLQTIIITHHSQCLQVCKQFLPGKAFRFRFPPVRVEDYGPIGTWANQESQHPTKIQEGLLFGKPTMPVPGFNQP